MEGRSINVNRQGCRPGAQFAAFCQMLFTFYSRTKWQVEAAKYRKENLEELRVGLRDHCERSLREFSHDLAIGGLLEFGKATAKVRSPSSFCVTVTYLTIYFLRLICSANMQSGKKHKACVKI